MPSSKRRRFCLTRRGLDGFFIHVDADSLNDDIMPAVDYRIPDGLTFGELATALYAALRSGGAMGLEITIYNPRLDKSGVAGRCLSATLAEVLGTSAPTL
jgi:arginase